MQPRIEKRVEREKNEKKTSGHIKENRNVPKNEKNDKKNDKKELAEKINSTSNSYKVTNMLKKIPQAKFKQPRVPLSQTKKIEFGKIGPSGVRVLHVAAGRNEVGHYF